MRPLELCASLCLLLVAQVARADLDFQKFLGNEYLLVENARKWLCQLRQNKGAIEDIKKALPDGISFIESKGEDTWSFEAKTLGRKINVSLPAFVSLERKNSITGKYEPDKGDITDGKVFSGILRMEECEFWTISRVFLDVDGRPEREESYRRLTSSWTDERVQFFNARVRPLEEIYGPCPENGDARFVALAKAVSGAIKEWVRRTPESFSNICEAIHNKHRVLITVVDSGIDYNHPALAFRVPRISQQEFDELLAERKSTKEEFDAIQACSPQTEELQHRLSELDARIRTAERELFNGLKGRDLQELSGLPYAKMDRWTEIEHSHPGSHGTHIAGIASQGDANIAILPIRWPRHEPERFKEALDYAVQSGSRIVNLSLGSEREETFGSLRDAALAHPDVLFVVAAGNEKQDLLSKPSFPASYHFSNMLVVGSVDKKGAYSSFSNLNDKVVDLAAPGEDIESAVQGGDVDKMSGTSMAAPKVANVAAKILLINPNFTVKEMKDIILSTLKNNDTISRKAGGVLDEEKALSLARKRATSLQSGL